jgi:hypothetical protein
MRPGMAWNEAWRSLEMSLENPKEGLVIDHVEWPSEN